MNTIKHTDNKKPTNYSVPKHREKVAQHDHLVHADHQNPSKTKPPAKAKPSERKPDRPKEPGFWAGFFMGIFLATADGPSANRREHHPEHHGKSPEPPHHFHSRDLANPKHVDFRA